MITPGNALHKGKAHFFENFIYFKYDFKWSFKLKALSVEYNFLKLFFISIIPTGCHNPFPISRYDLYKRIGQGIWVGVYFIHNMQFKSLYDYQI